MFDVPDHEELRVGNWVVSLISPLCYKLNEAVLLGYPFDSLVVSIVKYVCKNALSRALMLASL